MDKMRTLCLLPLIAVALQAQSLLPADAVMPFATVGSIVTEEVAATGPGFGKALRISTPQPGRSLDDGAFAWTNTALIGTGDRLTLTFWVRKVAPDDFYNIRASVSLESDTGDPLLSTVFPCNLNTWAKYSFPVTAPRSYQAGELRVMFRSGLGPQAFDIGGLQ